jgi:primosomal protein N''
LLYGTAVEKFRADGVAWVVEHLPSKHEALSWNPSTAKKQTNKQPTPKTKQGWPKAFEMPK